MRRSSFFLGVIGVIGMVGTIHGEPWDLSMNANFLLAMNTYSDNWTGGEAGSISWAAQMKAIAARQLNEKFHSTNTLKLAFGETHTQAEDAAGDKFWMSPAKSTDLIDFESLLKLTLGGFIDPYVAARLTSQFWDASVPGEDFYFNPLEITESFGGAMEWVKTDNVLWTARLGGAVRQLINRNVLDGEETDVTNDGGIEFVTELNAENKDKWLVFNSLLKIYEALFSSTAEDVKGTNLENDWRHPDVNWENTLTVNLNKYIMLSFYAQLLYDKEIDSNPRFKEVLSLGLTYTATSKK